MTETNEPNEPRPTPPPPAPPTPGAPGDADPPIIISGPPAGGVPAEGEDEGDGVV